VPVHLQALKAALLGRNLDYRQALVVLAAVFQQPLQHLQRGSLLRPLRESRTLRGFGPLVSQALHLAFRHGHGVPR